MFADLREWCLSFYTFRTGAGPQECNVGDYLPVEGSNRSVNRVWADKGGEPRDLVTAEMS